MDDSRTHVPMTTIDAHGNKHLGRGAPGAGQFAGRSPARPTESLVPGPHPAASVEERFRTAANNDFIATFEEEHPHATAGEYRAWLEAVPGEWILDRHGEEIQVFDGDERRAAVSALTARLAAGQAGILTEAGDLRDGDRVDLSRLWADGTTEEVEFASAQFGIVAGYPTETGEGETIVTLSNTDRPIVVPTGTVLPVQGVTFRGEQMTERELARRLAWETPRRTPEESPREVLNMFISDRKLEPGDDDYPAVIL